MKKLVAVLVIAVSVFSYIQIRETRNTEVNALLLENVDAMASGEIIIGPFCIQTSGICFVDYDGYFLRGYRQYF